MNHLKICQQKLIYIYTPLSQGTDDMCFGRKISLVLLLFFCVPDPNESRAAVVSLLMPFVRLIKMKSTIYIYMSPYSIYTKGSHT